MVRTLRLKRQAAASESETDLALGAQSGATPDPGAPPADTPPKPHDKPPRQDHPLLRKFEIRRGEDA